MQKLILENISKTYNVKNQKLEVVSNFSLDVHPGKFICLIGPNGCGKSTILKIISGITKHSSGKLKVPKNIAYLPQQGSLMPWLSVIDNLRLPAKLKGLSCAKIEKKIYKYLNEFELIEFAEYYPAELSGGMYQKVSLIRTVLYKPDLIILDEPFASLDSITRTEMQRWLSQLWQEYKSTVICVTHDIAEAVYLADVIVAVSSRPARVVRKFIVPMGRPRTLDKLSSAKSIKIQSDLQRILLND